MGLGVRVRVRVKVRVRVPPGSGFRAEAIEPTLLTSRPTSRCGFVFLLVWRFGFVFLLVFFSFVCLCLSCLV